MAALHETFTETYRQLSFTIHPTQLSATVVCDKI